MLDKAKILRELSLRQWVMTIIILGMSVWVGAGRDPRAASCLRRVGHD